MIMDNISLARTHSFDYLGINFQAKGFIQVDRLAIKRKFYSLYNNRPSLYYQRSASAAEPVRSQLVKSRQIIDLLYGSKERPLRVTPPKLNRFG